MIEEIERDYIDLNEYKRAKKEMEYYAKRIFNYDNLDEIIESLITDTIEDFRDIPF